MPQQKKRFKGVTNKVPREQSRGFDRFKQGQQTKANNIAKAKIKK